MTENILNDTSYEVEFLNCIIDKADDFRVIDSDSHFAAFVGVHISKIKQGKLFLKDIIRPVERDTIFKALCKKNSKYVYIDFNILDKDDSPVFVHCTAQNFEDSTLCRLVFADVSKSREKSRELEERANEVSHLIDLVSGGVCLFKVTPDMHLQILYINEACCRLFGTTKENYDWRAYDLSELIYKRDKTEVYQAIGRTLATGEDIDLEFRVLTHKDKHLWCKCNAAVQKYDGDGSPIFHAVFTDITKIKEAERRIDEANDKLINLLENLTGAIFFADLDKPFLPHYVSGDFARLIGYSRDIFESRFTNDLSKIIKEDPAELERGIKAQVAKGGKSEITYTISAKNGAAVAVRDTRKLVTQTDGTNTLISELKQIQE